MGRICEVEGRRCQFCELLLSLRIVDVAERRLLSIAGGSLRCAMQWASAVWGAVEGGWHFGCASGLEISEIALGRN